MGTRREFDPAPSYAKFLEGVLEYLGSLNLEALQEEYQNAQAHYQTTPPDSAEHSKYKDVLQIAQDMVETKKALY